MNRITADADQDSMLQLVLTVKQGNLVMMALAEYPFKRVYELIGKLNRQANAALHADHSYACRVDAGELKLMLDALSKLPYYQVYTLVHALQRQLPLPLQEQTASAIVSAGKSSKQAARRKNPQQ